MKVTVEFDLSDLPRPLAHGEQQDPELRAAVQRVLDLMQVPKPNEMAVNVPALPWWDPNRQAEVLPAVLDLRRVMG